MQSRENIIKAMVMMAAMASIADQLDDGDQVNIIDTETALAIMLVVKELEAELCDWKNTSEAMNNTKEGATFLKNCMQYCITELKSTLV